MPKSRGRKNRRKAERITRLKLTERRHSAAALLTARSCLRPHVCAAIFAACASSAATPEIAASTYSPPVLDIAAAIFATSMITSAESLSAITRSNGFQVQRCRPLANILLVPHNQEQGRDQ